MTEGIYRPPAAEPPPVLPIDRKRGRGVAIAGVCLIIAPLVGVLITVGSMQSSFRILSETGQADPAELAAEISVALVATMIGMAIGLVGAVLCGIAVYGRGNRETWFLGWGLALAILNLLVFPVGTICGVVLIIGFIMRWREFRLEEVGHVQA